MRDVVVPSITPRLPCGGGLLLLTSQAAHPCMAVEIGATQVQLVTRIHLAPQEDVVVRGTLAGLGHFETKGRVVDQHVWGSGRVYLTRVDLLTMPEWAVRGLRREELSLEVLGELD